MSDPEIRHSHVRLNNSVTHLIQYGCKESLIDISHQQSNFEPLETINERPQNQSVVAVKTSANNSAPSSRRGSLRSARLKQLIVFVPGNPGVLGVYHDFLVGLYKTIVKPSDKTTNVTILGLSHNDFDHPDSCNYKSANKINVEENDLNFIEISLAKEHRAHDVELQVLNKLIILKRIIKLEPGRYRVVFIGHSIGCYIILRLLQDRMVASTHAGSILIHPALENLALTKKGARISRYFNFKLDLVMKFTAYLCEFLLPSSLRLTLTRRICSPEFINSASEVVIESIAQLGCSNAVTALVEMAKDEFKQVRDMDHKALVGPHADKLVLIYAKGDEWVNVSNREELLKCYPSLRIEEQPALHAFVMDHGVVADYAMKAGMLVQDFFE